MKTYSILSDNQLLTARLVPLHDLLEEVVEELQPLATKKKQRITLQNESPIIKSMITKTM